MADDWAAGDLAMLVATEGVWEYDDTGAPCEGPEFGAICTVRRVGISPYNGSIILWFAEWPGDSTDDAYDECDWRKIEPYQFTEDDLVVIDLYKRVPEPTSLQQAGAAPGVHERHPLPGSVRIGGDPERGR